MSAEVTDRSLAAEPWPGCRGGGSGLQRPTRLGTVQQPGGPTEWSVWPLGLLARTGGSAAAERWACKQEAPRAHGLRHPRDTARQPSPWVVGSAGAVDRRCRAGCGETSAASDRPGPGARCRPSQQTPRRAGGRPQTQHPAPRPPYTPAGTLRPTHLLAPISQAPRTCPHQRDPRAVPTWGRRPLTDNFSVSR